MKVIFYNRDFTERADQPDSVRVERYSHHMIGGPLKATLKLTAGADRWELFRFLRCPVEIYGAGGKLVWWGFVNRITVPQGEQRFGRGLDNMYNNVVVRYANDGLTEAGTNAVSISEYGQKELVLRSYDLTGLEAAQLRNVELADKQNPKVEIEFSGGGDEIEIECLGWHDTLRWKHYTNTTESNVENTTQINTIATATGQFLQGVLVEDSAGVVSNQVRDARDGLSCVNELLQAGTSNSRPLLAYWDKNRYLHVYERSAEPPEGAVDYVMRDDGRLERLAGGALVPDQECTVAKWVKAKDSPIEFSFFIENAEYDVGADKTTYRPAGAYEQRRLAKYIADVVTGDGAHVWPGLLPPSALADEFSPYWVALGKDGDTITRIHAVAWDETNNIMYAGGEFTVIGGVEAANVAALDMETGQWSAMGDGLAGIVYSLGVLSDGTVYAGTGGTGHFWEWDGSTWTDLTSGGSGPTNVIVIDDSDNAYIGGAFSSLPGAATAKYAGVYTGAAFTAIPGLDWTGGGTGGVYGMALSGTYLYMTGKFDGGYAAVWDGATVSALGSGISGVGYDVTIHNGYPVFAGAFSTVEQWDGVQWTSLGSLTIGGGPSASAVGAGIISDGNNLYLVGRFDSTYHCARWDGGEWVSLGGGIFGGYGYGITLFDSVHPVVVGDFTHVGTTTYAAKGIAMYITTLDGLFDYLNKGGSSARPGGPDKAVQVNKEGRFFGENSLRYNYATNNLFLGDPLGPGDDEGAYTNTFFHSRDGGAPTYYARGWGDAPPRWLGSYAKGTKASPTPPLLGDDLYRFWAAVYDGDDYDNLVAVFDAVATENHGTSDQGSAWRFYVMPIGTAGAGNLKLTATVDEDGINLPTGNTFRVNGTPVSGGSWDGDITDIDETSSTDIGEAIADDDQGIIYNASGTAWVRFAWSRVKTYIQALTDTLYVALTGNQSVGGVKTFTSFPVTPSSAPSTDYEVANKKYVDDNAGGDTSGWVADTDTWTYATANTFTVSGDQTATFRRGVKIKLTQTTVKYFSVYGSSESGGTTTVTITGGDDYTLANAAITSPYYSLSENPDGFPAMFSWSPTFTGFSADPTGTHRIRMLPNGLFVDVQHNVNGTSNANTFYISAPPGVVLPDAARLGLAHFMVDNNVAITTSPGNIISTVGGTAYQITKDMASSTTSWTTSNGKRCRFTITHSLP